MQILFDIGASRTRVATTDNNKIALIRSAQTPPDPAQGIDLVADLARELSIAAKKDITVVAGGVPGVLNATKEIILSSPNLSGWNGVPLAERLHRELSVPVYLENDANLGALGEAAYGAGRDERIMAFLTISTGVGGGRIVDGHIDKYASGFEPGQQIMDLTSNKTLEDLVSGRAVKKRWGKDPKEVKDSKVWQELAKTLAVGITNTVVHWSPDVVVLGGPMMLGKPAIDITAVHDHLEKVLRIFPHSPKLRLGQLGDNVGLYGAMRLLEIVSL
jgi:glucokinase